MKLFDSSFFISILCLVIGLSSSIVLFLWIDNELSYDKFNKDGDNIYRLVSIDKISGIKQPKSACRLYKDLPAMYPQFSDGLLIGMYNNAGEESFFISKEDTDDGFFVNSIKSTDNFFSFFSYPIYEGSENMKLLPGQVAISKKIANKLFGNESAVGRSLIVSQLGFKETMEIVLVADVPANTHLPFDIVIPMTTKELKVIEDPRSMGCVYVKMGQNNQFSSSEIKDLMLYQKTNYDLPYILSLQPLYDIHLHSDFYDVYSFNNGKSSYVWIIVICLVLIIVVMTVNFATLHISYNIRNTKTMAIKKIFGSSDMNIILENAQKSFLYVTTAMVVSLLVVLAILPTIRLFMGLDICIKIDWRIIVFLLALLIVLPISSALFQYYCLYSCNLSELVKGRMRFIKGIRFSNRISAFQVSISAFLAVFTFSILFQISFMLKHDDGIDTTNLVSINSRNITSYNMEFIRNELIKNPNIIDVGICEGNIKDIRGVLSNVTWEGKEGDTDIPFHCWSTDAAFMKMVGLQLVEGRLLDESLNADDYFDGEYIGQTEYVINESACSVMGFKPQDIVGKRISVANNTGIIVGVVKDFNFRNLSDAITPLLIFYNPEYLPNVMVKILPQNKQQTLGFIKETVKPHLLTSAFDYHFVDDVAVYVQEQQMGKLSAIFFIISLLFSLIGFTSVIAYHIKQEMSNIAIRKVYGATLKQIISYYTKRELRIYLLLMLVAISVSCYISIKWLRNFAFHINYATVLSIGACVILAFLIMLIIIVSMHVKAATSKKIVDVISK